MLNPFLTNKSLSGMEKKVKTAAASKNFNIVGYIVFLIAGIYFSFIAVDKSTGPMFLFLAFIFDPYDQTVSFYKRKPLEQATLYAHLILAFAAAIYVFVI